MIKLRNFLPTYTVALVLGMAAVALATVPVEAGTQSKRCVVYADGTIVCAGCTCSGGSCTCD